MEQLVTLIKVTALAGMGGTGLGGIIGAFITITVIKSMNVLGPAKSVLLIVIMQIVSAYLIELFGILGTEKVKFNWGKVIGAVIAIIGIVVFFMSGENNSAK